MQLRLTLGENELAAKLNYENRQVLKNGVDIMSKLTSGRKNVDPLTSDIIEVSTLRMLTSDVMNIKFNVGRMQETLISVNFASGNIEKIIGCIREANQIALTASLDRNYTPEQFANMDNQVSNILENIKRIVGETQVKGQKLINGDISDQPYRVGVEYIDNKDQQNIGDQIFMTIPTKSDVDNLELFMHSRIVPGNNIIEPIYNDIVRGINGGNALGSLDAATVAGKQQQPGTVVDEMNDPTTEMGIILWADPNASAAYEVAQIARLGGTHEAAGHDAHAAGIADSVFETKLNGVPQVTALAAGTAALAITAAALAITAAGTDAATLGFRPAVGAAMAVFNIVIIDVGAVGAAAAAADADVIALAVGAAKEAGANNIDAVAIANAASNLYAVAAPLNMAQVGIAPAGSNAANAGLTNFAILGAADDATRAVVAAGTTAEALAEMVRDKATGFNFETDLFQNQTGDIVNIYGTDGDAKVVKDAVEAKLLQIMPHSRFNVYFENGDDNHEGSVTIAFDNILILESVEIRVEANDSYKFKVRNYNMRNTGDNTLQNPNGNIGNAATFLAQLRQELVIFHNDERMKLQGATNTEGDPILVAIDNCSLANLFYGHNVQHGLDTNLFLYREEDTDEILIPKIPNRDAAVAAIEKFKFATTKLISFLVNTSITLNTINSSKETGEYFQHMHEEEIIGLTEIDYRKAMQDYFKYTMSLEVSSAIMLAEAKQRAATIMGLVRDMKDK